MMNKLSYPRWLYKRAHAHVQIRMQLRSFLDTKNTQWYQRSSLPGLPGLPGLPQIFNFPNFLTLHFGSMCIYTIYIYIYEYSIFGQAISYCRTTDLYIYTSKRFQISHVDTAGDWFDIHCEAGTIVVWNPSRNPLLGLAQNSPPLVPEGLENSGKIDSNV